MDDCGGFRGTNKYQILAGIRYLIYSMYAQAGPDFVAKSTQPGQSPKMRNKQIISAISEGLNDVL